VIMTEFTVPYFASPSELPQPLPSQDEIDALEHQAKLQRGRYFLHMGAFFIKYCQVSMS
jgi:hypothetical protein